MANMKLIEAKTLGSTTASVTFSDIPNTYTDLKLVISARGTASYAATNLKMQVGNGTVSTSGYSERLLYTTNGTSAITYGQSSQVQSDLQYFPLATSTANTFSNNEIYIPNYTGSTTKSFSIESVSEDNTTAGILAMAAGLSSNTSAINIITLTPNTGNFAAGSTFYLYGISNVTEGSKATGGIVSYDSTYYYHMFPYSGTFTPTQSLTVDYLVVAGGGSGAKLRGAGGGAGGLRTSVGTVSGGGGSLESTLSLSASAYTITVGAGGAEKTSDGSNGNNGSNSSIAGSGITTVTSTGGGGGATYNVGPGSSGGSGGGGTWSSSIQAGGAPTANQGFAGGSGNGAPNYGAGGGGGAGVAGTNGTTTVGGNGGNGVLITAFAIPTATGANNGYYAGGGGGASYNGGTPGTGGSGGGGSGTNNTATKGGAGIANTGGGGGGGGYNGSDGANGGAGGSGIVIIRYAI
jgi:hypothetical protein